MHLRPIEASDLPALFEVRSRTRENRLSIAELAGLGITPAYVECQLRAELFGWLAETEGRVLGFAMGKAGTGELWVIALLPEAEGRGLGGRLLRRVEQGLAERGWTQSWLTTSLEPELRAYGFYRHQGWSDWKVEGGLRYMRKALTCSWTVRQDRRLEVEAFVDLLRRSTLAERRPVEDRSCLEAMLQHANLLCTAWAGERLIGLARAVTDFSYCCYLSDLAVDRAWQRRGVGVALLEATRGRLGPRCKLILLSAPKASAYYPKLGFSQHPSAWVLGQEQALLGSPRKGGGE